MLPYFLAFAFEIEVPRVLSKNIEDHSYNCVHSLLLVSSKMEMNGIWQTLSGSLMRMVSLFSPPLCMGKRLVQEKYVIKMRTPFQISSSQSQACRVAFIYMWCSSWKKKNLHIMFNFFYDRRLQWANANAKRHHCSAWCLDKVSFQPICDWFCLAGCERVKTFLISF